MTLELTKEEAQLVINALAELPAKISINLILKINEQISEQSKSDSQNS